MPIKTLGQRDLIRKGLVLQFKMLEALSIDGRHVFWDEPKTLRVILGSYDLIKTKPGIILLGARARARFTRAQLLGTLRVNASIERSATMRTIRTSFREDAVFLSLRFSSGEDVRFRILPDNAAEGLWLSPFPVTVDDLHTLLRRGPARRVVAVRFSTERLESFYQPIVLSWLQLMPVGGTSAGVQ